MSFRITGLSAEPFHHLFGLSDDALAQYEARRVVADSKPGYPDRIEMCDAEVGASLILVNYAHLPAPGPYRASHAIFVREGASSRFDRIGVVPDVLRGRQLSLRAFDAEHMMIDADLVDGREVEALIVRLLANPRAAYIHAHFAKRGCYAGRIERA